jgi:hypothetical protein
MNLKAIIKKYWYIIIILIVLAYLLYPKYSGESSVCTGNIKCSCAGYSYTTWAGPDAAYIKHCMGLVTSCHRETEGNIMGCA